ncbi:MAG: hypothetical protein ACLFPS_09695 [Clostridia bacterium]
MSELTDTIAPIDRARIGERFLNDIQEKETDIDIMIDSYVKSFKTDYNQVVLRDFLNELADVITKPN